MKSLPLPAATSHGARNWAQDGACVQRPEIFHHPLLDYDPELHDFDPPITRLNDRVVRLSVRQALRRQAELVVQAKTICMTCPVRSQCADWARDYLVSGVAAGYTATEIETWRQQQGYAVDDDTRSFTGVAEPADGTGYLLDDAQVMHMSTHMTALQIAEHFDVSTRTVERALQRSRRNGHSLLPVAVSVQTPREPLPAATVVTGPRPLPPSRLSPWMRPVWRLLDDHQWHHLDELVAVAQPHLTGPARERVRNAVSAAHRHKGQLERDGLNFRSVIDAVVTD